MEVSYFATASAATAGKASEGASYISLTLTALLLMVSFNAALILIKLFQMLEFFIYINIELPLNVQTFISYFDMNIFDMVPNLLETDESGIGCKLHPLLERNGMKCLSYNNIGGFLLQILMVLILKILVYFLTRIFKAYDKKKVSENPEYMKEKKDKGFC